MPAPPLFATAPGFHTTHWSVVLLARDVSSTEALTALEKLCVVYWQPLYTFARCSGLPVADAQDAVQGFFAQLIAQHGLRHVDPTKGRFRSFMLASLRNFMADQRDRANAGKRGGGIELLPLDFALAERAFERDFAKSESPERAFDRAWAMAVLDRVQSRLREEYITVGKGALHEALGPGSEEGSHAAVGARLGLSESAVKTAAFRLRRRHRELIRAEIAQTVSNESELSTELDELLRSIGGS